MTDSNPQDLLTKLNSNPVPTSDLIHLLRAIRRLTAEERDDEGLMLLAVQHFEGRKAPAFSAFSRLQALPAIFDDARAAPWVKGKRGADTVFKNEILTVAASLPLILVDDVPVFDRDAFFGKLLELAPAEAAA